MSAHCCPEILERHVPPKLPAEPRAVFPPVVAVDDQHVRFRSSLASGKANPSPRPVAEFLASALGLAGCPAGGEPEIALEERSNAGESSVLNRLTSR